MYNHTMEIELSQNQTRENATSAINEKLLTIDEVSKKLRVSHMTLRRWDKNGKLKAIQFHPHSKRLYKKEVVEAFMIHRPPLEAVELTEKEEASPEKTTKIELKSLGQHHESHEDAERDWQKIQDTLKTTAQNDTIEIDFTDTAPIGLKWTKGFLIPLHRHHKGKIRMINMNNLGDITMLELTGLYTQQSWMPY